MPIRFRCAYCNQLMGIARRKAGQVVRCPKCAGEIIVPVPEGMEPPDDPAEPAGPQAFEDPNFGQSFPPPPVPDPSNATVPMEQGSAPYPVPPPSPPPAPKRLGLFLPLGLLILSFGAIVLLMILMFVLGLIIGRYSVSGEHTPTAGVANPSHHACSFPATSRSPSAAPDPVRNSCPA